MKSIIYGSIATKKYIFGETSRWGNGVNAIHEFSDQSETGRILSEERFLENKKLEETNKFNRELMKGELIKIGEIEYPIHEKSYETNGDINYYLKYKEVIEDLESKTEAERKLELRKAYLKGKEYVSIKNFNDVTEMFTAASNDGGRPIPSKKWYQF